MRLEEPYASTKKFAGTSNGRAHPHFSEDLILSSWDFPQDSPIVVSRLGPPLPVDWENPRTFQWICPPLFRKPNFAPLCTVLYMSPPLKCTHSFSKHCGEDPYTPKLRKSWTLPWSWPSHFRRRWMLCLAVSCFLPDIGIRNKNESFASSCFFLWNPSLSSLALRTGEIINPEALESRGTSINPEDIQTRLRQLLDVYEYMHGRGYMGYNMEGGNSSSMSVIFALPVSAADEVLVNVTHLNGWRRKGI